MTDGHEQSIADSLSCTPMPSAQPVPSSSARAVAWVLRAGLAIQAGALLWFARRQGTEVGSALFMHAGWSETSSARVDLGLAGAGAAAALLLLVTPRRRALQLAAAACLALVFAVHAALRIGLRGDAFAHLAPAAQAVRWLGPLALPWLLPELSPAQHRRGRRLLALAVAATFTAHGLEALAHHPRFCDLLLGAARRLFDLRLTQSSAEAVLTAIGVLDLAVAAALVLRPRPAVALWAALWGTLTLASRTVSLGPDFFHESALRSMNAAAPLALGLALLSSRREPTP